MEIGADYERVIVLCHRCEHTNVFNRATDLGHTGFAIGTERPCEKCGQPVRVTFEAASPAYQLLIRDAYEMRSEKRYMLAVAAVAQSFEMFFALAVEIMVVHHVAHFGSAADDEIEQLANELFNRTKSFTYSKMRNLFTNVALIARPANVAEAASIIASVNKLAKDPSDATIERTAVGKLIPHLLQLKQLPLGSLRNMVVHKYAYRPLLEEVDRCLDPARALTDDLWITLV